MRFGRGDLQKHLHRLRLCLKIVGKLVSQKEAVSARWNL